MFPYSSSSGPSPRTAFTLPPNWTLRENKDFELALTLYPAHMPKRWESIAKLLPGKSAQDVYEHYMRLTEDVLAVDYGLIEFQCSDDDDDDGNKEDAGESTIKGPPWTDDEQKRFMEGVEKHGCGSWVDIAGEVITRTTSQVICYANKYFNIQASGNKRS